MGEGQEFQYKNSSRAELDHYFGNYIGAIQNYFYMAEEDPNFELPQKAIQQAFEKFIDGLRKIIKKLQEGSLQADPQINKNVLEEFIKICQNITDPTDKNQMKILFKKFINLQ